MSRQQRLLLPFYLIIWLTLPVVAGAQGEWRLDPLTFKYKVKEEEVISSLRGVGELTIKIIGGLRTLNGKINH